MHAVSVIGGAAVASPLVYDPDGGLRLVQLLGPRRDRRVESLDRVARRTGTKCASEGDNLGNLVIPNHQSPGIHFAGRSKILVVVFGGVFWVGVLVGVWNLVSCLGICHHLDGQSYSMGMKKERKASKQDPLLMSWWEVYSCGGPRDVDKYWLT